MHSEILARARQEGRNYIVSLQCDIKICHNFTKYDITICIFRCNQGLTYFNIKPALEARGAKVCSSPNILQAFSPNMPK